MKILDRETHPAADAFPLMNGAEFANLIDDIKRNGVRHKGVLYKGCILDGRNRGRAAEQLGAVMDWDEYAGDDPVGLVVSLNISRRHLNESQRAMVAARLALLPHGTNRHTKSRKSATLPPPSLSLSEAAAMLNVGERSVSDAHAVMKGEPEVVAAVDRGDLSVSAAAELVKLPPEKQREVAASSAINGGDIRRMVKAATSTSNGTVDPCLVMLRAFMKACDKIGATTTLLDSDGLRVAFRGKLYLLQIRDETPKDIAA